MKTPRKVVLLSTSSSIPKPVNRLWILIREASSYFLPFALAMATVVGFLRWHVESSYREEILSWQVRLSGVADNNAESVSEWLKERLADTRVLSASPVIRSVLRAESKGGQFSKSPFVSEPDPLFVLEEIATSYSYAGVYILDRDVRVVMQSRGSIPFNTLWTESCRAVDRSGVARVDLIGDSPSRTVVGSIAPVFLGPAAADNGPPPPGQLLGSVLLVSDASKTLVPLLKREALPTRTGETILILREGNEIVFFSPLRHTPANAPSLRFPLAAAPLPARYAVEGRAAFVQFNDYRGVPVLAATRNIPLTGWGLVRKIDRAEALEEFNHGKLLEELAAGLMILLLGGVLIVSRRYIIAREQDRTEKELRRLNRALRTMRECSLVLVKAEDESNLLNQVCETVVRVGGYRMAWVGFPERDEGKSVRPVAQAGFEDGYLQTANITWADTERGNGPTGSAIRTGKPVVAQDILSDPSLAAWREEAQKRGYASCISLPLIAQGQVLGALMIDAGEPDAFDSEEVQLLMELSNELAYGIQSLRAKAERQRAEESLQHERVFTESIIDSLPDSFFIIDSDRRYVRWNRNAGKAMGYSAEEFAALEPLALVVEDERSLAASKMQEAWTSGSATADCHVLAKDGRRIPYLLTASRAAIDGKPYLIGMGIDITERKRMEEALQETAALLNETGRIAKVGGWELNLLTHKLTWTKEVFRIHEVDDSFVPTVERGIGFYAPESRPVIRRAVERASEHSEAFDLELELVTARGKRLSVRAIGGKQARHDGTFVVAGTFQDVTERNLAESALRASEVRYRRLFEAAQDGILILDADSGEIRDVNPFLTDLLGFSQAELLGKKLWEIGPLRDVLLSRVSFEELQTRGYVRYEDLPLETRDGRQIAVEFVSNVYLADDKKVIQCNIRDITARKEAEEEHVRLVTAIEQSAEAVVITNPAGDIEYVNSAFTQITGYSREEALGKNPRILKSGKQDPEFYQQLWETIVNGQTWEGELINRRKNGTHYTEKMSITAVRDRAGMATHFIATKQDITERRNLEAKLHQASKMEAVGRLAGGVAHDFNNLLTVINGYSEVLMERLASDTKSSGYLEEIHKAGERAASLTRQLLAFSRHQVLAPQVLDMNAVVSNLGNMLRRLIGEDIKLRTLLNPSLARVKADPGQIEQVIINLAVNARDAMPKGGNLTIETSNVELDEEYARIHPTVKPGPHAVLVVSDTGEGMTPETQARIFEPFFTTKEMGKGTGLGLATVYGIVKQSGGSVWVYSEVGTGTTFKIYFPVVSDGSEAKESPKLETDSAGGTETVLLVEDEEGVRLLVRLALVSKGYKVLEAPDPKSALAICSSHDGPIHLLLTDVVMPQMSGPEVASKVAALRPSIRVLYMSGYTDDSVVHHGVLSQEMSFIQKPFSSANLRKKIREVLDGTKGRGSGAGQARD